MKGLQKIQLRRKIYLLAFFIIVSLLLFIFRDSVAPNFENFFQTIFKAPKSFVYNIGRGESNDKTQEILKENKNLMQKISDYQLLQKDNDALRSQFNTTGIDSQNLIAAKIIGFLGDRDNPTTFVINAGSNQGIQKNMSVIFEKNLVGNVTSVNNNFSVVTTVLNPSFRTLAKVPSTNAFGILEGQGDFLLLDKVVITDNLSKNATVVTKGEVNEKGIGIFPDLTLGTITFISKNETAPFQSAKVTSPIDLSKLTEVFVVKQL